VEQTRAWIEAERGMRNVYTAAAPRSERVRLTTTLEDDALDLTSVQLSEDGTVAVFMRGHPENFKGQFGNQSWDPAGGRREKAADEVEEGRLPRAVRADHPENPVPSDLVVDGIDGSHTAAPAS
jgi:hypothetical protein